MKKQTFRLLPLTSALLLTGLAQQAGAAGFQLIEQSGSGMGNAYAGAAAVAEDASTIYFNPAGLTKITKPQMVFAGHIISTSADFEDKGSSVNPALTGGTVVKGSLTGSNDDGGGTAFVPNFYYARPINDKLVFGFGANAPFGLETDYEDDWVGRYHALNSAVQTVNLNPSLGYKVNEKLSIGGGVSIQYIHADLTSAIDSAAVCLSAAASSPALTTEDCVRAGLGPNDVSNSAKDSKAELEADNVAFGFNLGVTYDFNDKTRVGVSYRSGIEQEAEGDADFTVGTELSAVLPGINQGLSAVNSALLVDTGITATVDLPDSASFSVAHQATPKIQLLADVTWTGWSSFEELRIKYDSGQADSVTTEAWENTMRYSIGVNYDHTDKLRLRAGLAFDEEAIPDAEHRTPRIPGNDRTWIAFGAGYDYSDTMHFDVGFAHLFIDDTPSDHEDEGNGYHFRGEYEGDVNILSAQMNWNF